LWLPLPLPLPPGLGAAVARDPHESVATIRLSAKAAARARVRWAAVTAGHSESSAAECPLGEVAPLFLSTALGSFLTIPASPDWGRGNPVRVMYWEYRQAGGAS
jgi:hypothetical protein